MQRIPVRAATLALMLCALVCGPTDAQAVRPGGYTIGSETCGRGPFAFPRLRIGLRDGYCAGMVASAEDGLQFPRSIIQIPGHALLWPTWEVGFVPRADCCFDPSLPSGRRTKVLLDGIDYPFGLAIGADKKIYSSTTETIFRFEPLGQPSPRAPSKRSCRACPRGTSGSGRQHDRRERAFDEAIRVRCGWPAIRECRCAHGRMRDQGDYGKELRRRGGARSDGGGMGFHAARWGYLPDAETK